MATGRGMLLERLFVQVIPQYKGGEMKEATRDVGKLENRVESLNKMLNAMTAALTAAATAGVVAFSTWDRQLSTLAIKAGVTNKEFKELYETQARMIGRRTGVDPVHTASAFQKAHSQGVVGRAADSLVEAAAVLMREGVATLDDSVDTAIAISRGTSGRIDPKQVLEQITRAGQVGQGESRDYAMAAKELAPIGRAIGIELSELMAGFGITAGQAASPEKARTAMRAAIEFLTKNPTKQAQELMASKGTSQAELKKLADTAFVDYLRFIRDNFSEDEFFGLTGSVEGAQGLGFLIPQIDQIARNTNLILNTSRGVIEGIEQDSGSDFTSSLDKLRITFLDFVRQFGKPFATVLTPFIQTATKLLEAIIRLNDATDGLLMWLPAMVSGLLAFRAVAGIVGGGLSLLRGGAIGGGLLSLLGIGGGAAAGAGAGAALSGVVRAWIAKEVGFLFGYIMFAFKAVFAGLSAAFLVYLAPLLAGLLRLQGAFFVFVGLLKGFGNIFRFFLLTGKNGIPAISIALRAALVPLIAAFGMLAVKGLAFLAIFGGVTWLLAKLFGAIGRYAGMSDEEKAERQARRTDMLDRGAAGVDSSFIEVESEWSMLMDNIKERWRKIMGLEEEIATEADSSLSTFESILHDVIDFFVNFDEHLLADWKMFQRWINSGISGMLASINETMEGGAYNPRRMLLDIQTALAKAGVDLYNTADGKGLVDENGNLILTDVAKLLEASSATGANALTGKALTIHNENEWTITLTAPDGSTQTFTNRQEPLTNYGDFDGTSDFVNRASDTFQIGG